LIASLSKRGSAAEESQAQCIFCRSSPLRFSLFFFFNRASIVALPVALFFGQRMAKDYAGAAVLVPLFLLALSATYLLGSK
jgi:hypothetical protein